MEKSQEALRAAKFNKTDFPETAIEKAYYSTFYAAHSLLALREIEPKSHEGVNHKLGEVFAQTGLLPKEIFKTLGVLENNREKATYNLAVRYTAEDAHERIERAEIFINAIENLIKKELAKEVSPVPQSTE